MMDGIILTGGLGTRLAPQSHITNKHLLLLNNKFIIDYPLQTLKNMGVENLTVVLGGNHFEQIVKYLKDGSEWGFNVNYCYQREPKGIAQAINLCQPYVKGRDFVTILGDNIYEKPINWPYNPYLSRVCASVVLYDHPELKRFGVASIQNNKIVNIEEKPKELNPNAKNLAITGCYKFTDEYFEFFKQLRPSKRGEFEICDIISLYNSNNKLTFTTATGLWSDAGTFESIEAINKYFYCK